MRLRPILWLATAGLLSAIFGICFIQFTFYAAGAWFGGATAICLKKFGIFDNQQTSRFVIVCIVAYLLSFVAAVMLSVPFRYADYTAFVGAGFLGGLLLTAGTVWWVRPRLIGIGVLVGAVCGPLCGGLLAGLGQFLGPSVGMTVMKMLAPLPWVPSTNRSNPLVGPSFEYQDLYSIFVVWQTGMALLLGLILTLCLSQPSVDQDHAADQDQSSAVIPSWFR